jgi:hypothetical protein
LHLLWPSFASTSVKAALPPGLGLHPFREVTQAELTLLHCPEAEGGFKGHRLPVLRVAPKLGTYGRFRVRARLLKAHWGQRADLAYDSADPELRRGGALSIAGLLTPLARATARVLKTRGSSQPPRMGFSTSSSEAVVNNPCSQTAADPRRRAQREVDKLPGKIRKSSALRARYRSPWLLLRI